MRRVIRFDSDAYVLYENVNDPNVMHAVANHDNEIMLQQIRGFEANMAALPDNIVVPAYDVIVVDRPNKFEEHLDIETNIPREVKVNTLSGTWIKK